jgi:hypothetical protein
MSTKVVYKVEEIGEKEIAEMYKAKAENWFVEWLNSQGKDGWSLVQIIKGSDYDLPFVGKYIFSKSTFYITGEDFLKESNKPIQ